MIKDPENRKKYFHEKNKETIKIRLNSEERSLLDIMRNQEGWAGISTFVKYKLFGEKPEKTLADRLSKKKAEDILISLKDEIQYLSHKMDYLELKYKKDTKDLSGAENIKRKTNHWNAEISKAYRKTLKNIELIIKAIGLDDKAEENNEK